MSDRVRLIPVVALCEARSAPPDWPHWLWTRRDGRLVGEPVALRMALWMRPGRKRERE